MPSAGKDVILTLKLASVLSTSAPPKAFHVKVNGVSSVAVCSTGVTVGASFAPLIVTVTTFAVPSTLVTVNVSVKVLPTFNACTVALLLFNV